VCVWGGGGSGDGNSGKRGHDRAGRDYEPDSRVAS